MEQYAQYAIDPQVRARRLARAQGLTQAAEQLKQGQLPRVPAAEAAGEDDYADAVSALIHKSSVTWDDIAGLDETKREIKTAYALTVARKPAGVELTAPRTMLLYGPPGTGKTLLAAATSNGLDATFFSVKVSDVLSKYFGESSKLVGALYSEARRHAPAVIFLDEFDAISRARGEGGESGAERRLLSTLLAELDGLNTKDDSAFVLTIAATNRVWDIDSAVRSRFAREVYVPLPDAPARQRILEIHLREKGHKIRVPYEKLMARTEGYSGREIAQMCEQAVAHMVGRVNLGLEDVVDRGREAVAEYQIKVKPLRAEDFDAAFEAVGEPETTEADLQKFARWREEGE
jgi:SpoVK/Ycf46/Vps4 family AAA+-type ATPase